MNNTAKIFNIQHFSLNDGPGIRTVIFMKGCPLNCAWCHNPESKSTNSELSFLADKCIMCGKCAAVCENKVHTFVNDIHSIKRTNCTLCGKCVDICMHCALELIGKDYTYDEIMMEIAKDDIFFSSDGGVTFSGGEPFAQPIALYNLLKLCKEKGYSTCIETSGFTTKENILKTAPLTDYFLLDCKETNPEIHKKYVGCEYEAIINNLDLLNQENANVILRCPIIPNVNDRIAHFEKIAILPDKYKCIKSVEFMPYHPLGISKSIQIGKKCDFENNTFLDKKRIENLLSVAKEKIKVPIKIN